MPYRPHEGGLNSKLHAVCDGQGRPLVILLSEGQLCDYEGAALMIDALPKANTLLGDQGYDVDWFRQGQCFRAPRLRPGGGQELVHAL